MPETSVKFLAASGSKFQYDINNNGNPAIWLGVKPNEAKDNFSLEFINGVLSYETFYPINIDGNLEYSFTLTGIIPESAVDLGSTTKPFKDLYLNGVLKIDNITVVKEQQAHIADPAGGTTVDTNARTVINSILNLLEAHGLMAP